MPATPKVHWRKAGTHTLCNRIVPIERNVLDRELVTCKECVADLSIPDIRSKKVGRKHLTKEAVQEIKGLLPPHKQNELAIRFECSPMAISDIARGVTHKEVKGAT